MPAPAPKTSFDIAERPSQLPWPPILLVAVIAAAIVLEYISPLPWPGLDDLTARIIGRSIGIVGIVLLVWAILTLRRHDTTVLPDAGASHLVTTGPYRRFRNPIYLADTMILFGAAELTKNVWLVIAAVSFVLLVTWLAILPEEQHLERRFGQAYVDYKAKSRRWI